MSWPEPGRAEAARGHVSQRVGSCEDSDDETAKPVDAKFLSPGILEEGNSAFLI